jgi:PTH1 family peptidyl-tRNA hydrolase
MNLSGKAASDALSYFKIPSTELLIVHDDSDLSIGTYKLAYDRGAGGHHGVESIVDHLNTQSFWRGRIGIRPETAPSLPRPKAGDFVLHPIRPSDIEIFSRVFDSFWKEVGFDLI